MGFLTYESSQLFYLVCFLYFANGLELPSSSCSEKLPSRLTSDGVFEPIARCVSETDERYGKRFAVKLDPSYAETSVSVPYYSLNYCPRVESALYLFDG